MQNPESGTFRRRPTAGDSVGGYGPLSVGRRRHRCWGVGEELVCRKRRFHSHAAVLLATSPKSNTAYLAYAAAKADIEAGLGQQMPPYLRPSNSFDGYKYPHEFENRWVEQRYLPYDLGDKKYYEYGDCKNEQAAKAYWEKIKKK